MSYRVIPETKSVVLLARFVTPVSHHDPSVQDKSNENLFLRRGQVVDRTNTQPVSNDEVQRLAHLLPVPETLADVLQTLSTPDFLAVALIKEFILSYASADGVGLFSGIERYRRLEERAKQQAIQSASVFGWWSGLSASLQTGMPLRGNDAVHAALLGISPALAQMVLVALATNSTSAVMLARYWNEAERNNISVVSVALPTIHNTLSSRMVVEVPAFSANTIRHKAVREPGAWHLLNTLGLQFDDLGDGAAALLYNGGDLNTSAPSDAFKLTRDIRAAYPSLGLLGGSVNGFVLGSSNLEESAWLVCTENAYALEMFDVTPELSAFDLLDHDHMTRHTNKRIEGSPMPFGFETLVAGSEVLIEFRLRPYATDLEAGALAAALTTYIGADSTLGGQSARGFGLARFEVQRWPESLDRDCESYEMYLQDRHDWLRAGLLDGTLTTGKAQF